MVMLEFVKSHIMQHCVNEAKKFAGFTGTNPCVGACLVEYNSANDYRILFSAGHEKYGEGHAERNLLTRYEIPSEMDMKNIYLFVTLEPCSTHGKTPPCTDIIIEKGIKNVIIGTLDPNPEHSGSAVEIFQQHDIHVEYGIEEDACISLILPFIKYVSTKRPMLTLKLATSLDGKVATKTSESRWITGKIARRDVHEIRYTTDAIMTTSTTALADNPMLTVRHVRHKILRQPDKILIDSKLRVPLDNNIFMRDAGQRVIILYGENVPKADKEKYNNLENVILVPVKLASNGFLSIENIIERLGEFNYANILMECGGIFAKSALPYIDSMIIYIAPMIIGADGISAFTNTGVEHITDAIKFRLNSVLQVADDVKLTYNSNELDELIEKTKSLNKI